VTRTLILVGDFLSPAQTNAPRRDFDALAEALDADVIDAGAAGATGGRLRKGVTIARFAAKRARDYDNIYCDSEHIGIPLAWLLAGRKPLPRLTMIGHYLTPAKKRLPARLLRVHRGIALVAVHAPVQIGRARQLGLRATQIKLVPYQVDSKFWHPKLATVPLHIASVGQEFRDYPTLAAAVDGLDVRVEVAAGSLWSSRDIVVNSSIVPANMQVRRRSYEELRDLYAASYFVVVPLHDVDFQAGIIAILESMAMGKAVIVSRTRGQSGTVSGRFMKHGDFQDIDEKSWPSESGIYVPPADPKALREAIVYLLENPAVAASMGEQGRLHVEAEFTLERFVERMAVVVAGAAPTRTSKQS
jgi:glycosyltransferase involved in cell wall biosynthesis